MEYATPPHETGTQANRRNNERSSQHSQSVFKRAPFGANPMTVPFCTQAYPPASKYANPDAAPITVTSHTTSAVVRQLRSSSQVPSASQDNIQRDENCTADLPSGVEVRDLGCQPCDRHLIHDIAGVRQLPSGFRSVEQISILLYLKSPPRLRTTFKKTRTASQTYPPVLKYAISGASPVTIPSHTTQQLCASSEPALKSSESFKETRTVSQTYPPVLKYAISGASPVTVTSYMT
jgi:hypothetical protein